MHLCYRRFLLNLIWRVSYQKQLFESKLTVNWAKAATNKFGTPYLLIAATITTSNCVYNFGLGCSLSRKNFWNQNWCGVSARGASKNIWNPYLFVQPLKLYSDFKFGTQHEFEFTLSETTFGTKIGGSEIGEYPKMWDPTFIHSFIHSQQFVERTMLRRSN